MMFAQTAVEIGSWMLPASFVLNFALGIVAVVALFKPHKTDVNLNEESKKREVQVVGDCADKEDNDIQHDKLEKKIEGLSRDAFAKIGGVERGAAQRLDDYKKEVNERFDAIQETLRHLPAEIVTLLKNTGGI